MDCLEVFGSGRRSELSVHVPGVLSGFWRMRMDKLIGLSEAAALVPSGCTLALGGMTIYRRPIAFVKALSFSKS